MSIYAYLLTLTEGVLTFISPCILPILPVYFLYLAGVSSKDISASPFKKSKIVTNSIGFVLGFTIVFVLLGAVSTTIGHFLVDNKEVFRQISGIIMIVFGLNFIGLIKLDILNVEKRLEYKFEKLDFLSSIIFGMTFGFGWTPCLGAFLGSALVLASSSDTIWQGILLLLIYSIGLGLPFILTAVIFDNVKTSLKYLQKHGKLISIISGVLLIAAGILVFTDRIKYFSFI